MYELPASLRGLARYNKFLICKLVPKKDDDGNLTGKMDKVPVNPNGLYPHNPKDPEIQLSADAAVKMLNEMNDPEYLLGFQLGKEDPFFLLDIDGAWIEEEKRWNDISNQLVTQFAGAAVEVSQSGRGLHIIGSGYCPDHGCKYPKLGLELYTHNRFIALGLQQPSGDADTDCTKALGEIVPLYFSGNAAVDDGEWNTEPVEGSSPIEDDDVLINKALVSKSAAAKFGAKASFKQLWENDEDALAEFWPPDNQSDPYDRSHADMALAQHLAFWTGGDHERMLRLMNESALKRDKWEARGDYYLPMTIRKAVTSQSQFYNKDYRRDEQQTDNPTVGQAPQTADGEPPQTSPTGTILFDRDMMELWKDFVYVTEAEAILDPHTGRTWKQSQFKNEFGGKKYVYTAEGKQTEDAWKAFTQNQVHKFPVAYASRLDPTRAEGEIFYDAEFKMSVINNYVRHQPRLVKGDPGPFLDLLERVWPDDRDRDILLSYIARAVQSPGEKFRYALVLQGAQGTGKSTIGDVISYCLGHRYVFLPKAKQFAEGLGKFNFWMTVNLFVIIEEIKKPRTGTAAADDFDSAVKTFITQKWIEIEGKGVNQRMERVLSNYLFITNKMEHFPIVEDDRRYTPMYSALQSKSDVLAAGMGDEYFREFFEWFNADGIAIVAQYLLDYAVNKEFDPLLIATAPRSSAFELAMTHSKSDKAEIIEDAISEGRAGFCGGWVSSTKARELLSNEGYRGITGKTVAAALRELGYVKHPGLLTGKTPSRIKEEGNLQVSLYVRKAHPLCELNSAEAVVARYCDDQGYVVPPGGARNFA